MATSPHSSKGSSSLLESARRGAHLAKEAVHDPREAVYRLRSIGAAKIAPKPAGTTSGAAKRDAQRPTRRPGVHLDHAQALRENGFTIYRGLFAPEECARLARELKQEAGITEGVEYTRVDSTNKFAGAREVVFDERLLGAVREAIGAQAKFLQVSDLHYLHDTAAWHRDSVHRAKDASEAPDWSGVRAPFGVVKAILYMESDNAGMGIMAGSHLSPIEVDMDHMARVERAGGQIVIDDDDDPNQRFTAEERLTPLAWQAQAGDVLVFDERMFHAGRRVENGVVNKHRDAAKFTLSLVFCADNYHSERMYSYFRYARRELSYKDLPPDYRSALADRGLVLTAGWGNYYLRHPDDLRHAFLRRPETLEPLIAEFTRDGAALRAGSDS